MEDTDRTFGTNGVWMVEAQTWLEDGLLETDPQNKEEDEEKCIRQQISIAKKKHLFVLETYCCWRMQKIRTSQDLQ